MHRYAIVSERAFEATQCRQCGILFGQDRRTGKRPFNRDIGTVPANCAIAIWRIIVIHLVANLGPGLQSHEGMAEADRNHALKLNSCEEGVRLRVLKTLSFLANRRRSHKLVIKWDCYASAVLKCTNQPKITNSFWLDAARPGRSRPSGCSPEPDVHSGEQRSARPPNWTCNVRGRKGAVAVRRQV